PGGNSGQTGFTTTTLNTYFSDDNVDSFDLHSVATEVILMFANDSSESGNTNWQNAAQYFWPVLYDNTFADDIGMTQPGRYGLETVHGADKDMRTMIAYSEINSGTEIFGDTGIVALYHDADALGQALALSNVSQSLVAEAKDISESFVQFAGQMALNKVSTEA